jgi:hypothetical protein
MCDVSGNWSGTYSHVYVERPIVKGLPQEINTSHRTNAWRGKGTFYVIWKSGCHVVKTVKNTDEAPPV